MLNANLTPFWNFISERHAIYLRKTLLEGKKPPKAYDPSKAVVDKSKWSLDHLTDDPILHEYRFCCVFRELDRVTIWIREHIREPYAQHEYLWLMLAIGRTFNWPPTLQELVEHGGWPDTEKFRPQNMTKLLQVRSKAGEKIHTGAFMIRAESNPKASWFHWTKNRYLAEIVIGKLWKDRKKWNDFFNSEESNSLEAVWKRFQTPHYTGWGKFMAFEVVTDLRWTRYLNKAPDVNTWANAGPGALRGLIRLFGAYHPSQACVLMIGLLEESRKGVLGKHVPQLELRDIEHQLCEYDKYIRVKKGEGRPRAKYVVGRGY